MSRRGGGSSHAQVLASTQEARPIYSTSWEHEREVAFGPAISWAELEPNANPQWVVLDVTDLVSDWHSGVLANGGLLVKLVDD